MVRYGTSMLAIGTWANITRWDNGVWGLLDDTIMTESLTKYEIMPKTRSDTILPHLDREQPTLLDFWTLKESLKLHG